MTPADEIERRLRRIYAQAGAELAKKLADFQKKSAERAAKKLKQLQDGKITQEEYASWMRGQIFQTEQWEKKIDQATGTLLDANREALQIVEKEKMGVFAENANYQAFQLTKDAGVALNFAVYDMDTVGRLIREEPELMPRKVVDGKKDKAWNRTQIANAVTQGIIQGEGIPDIAKRIARDTASTNMKAMNRYARTAMTEAQNAGRMETIKRGEELGIKCKKCWLATLDSRTRDSHQRMDGKKVDVDEDFVTPLGSRMKYPGDTAGKPGDVWNCRCTMTYEYDGYEGDETERIAYNEWDDVWYTTEKDKNGREYQKKHTKHHRDSYTIQDMTYQQWKTVNSPAKTAAQDKPSTQRQKAKKKTNPVDTLSAETRDAIEEYTMGEEFHMDQEQFDEVAEAMQETTEPMYRVESINRTAQQDLFPGEDFDFSQYVFESKDEENGALRSFTRSEDALPDLIGQVDNAVIFRTRGPVDQLPVDSISQYDQTESLAFGNGWRVVRFDSIEIDGKEYQVIDIEKVEAPAKQVKKELDNTEKNGNMATGGFTGAKKTPGWQDRHADRYYEEVRKREPYDDADKIAKSAPFTKEEAETVRKHVFLEKHDLGDRVDRFDSDYWQAEAWQRLTNGEGTEEDNVFMRHELEEQRLEKEGYSHDEAHEMANKKFNWWALVEKRLKKK